MRKITLKIITLLLVLTAFRPSVCKAQPCPMGIWNNADKLGLVNMDVYNTFAPGTYYVTLIAFDPNSSGPPCFIVDMPVSITKTNIMNSIIPGAAGGPGIVFNFPPNSCDGGSPLPDNGLATALQFGSTSVLVKTDPLANPILTVNYTDNQPDECIYTIVPVIFGPFNANLLTSPNRVKLDWTTYTEQDGNHFTIQKSINGANFYKIGEVTAVGNSNSPVNYTFTDNSPNNHGYYRVISVDNNCYWQYTGIDHVACSSCGTTFNPPNLPADCSQPPVVPIVVGPSLSCTNAKKVYRLNNVKGNAQVTWSIYPSYLANLSQGSRLVGLTPTGSSGIGTLTATVVKNGVTSYYSEQITFGIPQLYVYSSIDPGSPCVGGSTFTATVSLLPNTSQWEYSWYQNGYLLGYGDHYTWSYYPGQVINYEVHYTSPCGVSIIYGTTGGGPENYKPIARSKYSINPNPVRSTISIARYPIDPCGPVPPDPGPGIPVIDFKSAHSAPTKPVEEKAIIVKLYDVQGNLRKTTKISSSATRINISTEGLQTGIYFAQISEPGQEDVKLKVMIEK